MKRHLYFIGLCALVLLATSKLTALPPGKPVSISGSRVWTSVYSAANSGNVIYPVGQSNDFRIFFPTNGNAIIAKMGALGNVALQVQPDGSSPDLTIQDGGAFDTYAYQSGGNSIGVAHITGGLDNADYVLLDPFQDLGGIAPFLFGSMITNAAGNLHFVVQNMTSDGGKTNLLTITGDGSTTASRYISQTGFLVHSNTLASIPTLAKGDNYYWSSNGVAFVICSGPTGTLTTNHIAP